MGKEWIATEDDSYHKRGHSFVLGLLLGQEKLILSLLTAIDLETITPCFINGKITEVKILKN